MRLITIQSLGFQGRFPATYDSLAKKNHSLMQQCCLVSISLTSCIIILRNESLKGQEHCQIQISENPIQQMKLNLSELCRSKSRFPKVIKARDFPGKVTFNYQVGNHDGRVSFFPMMNLLPLIVVFQGRNQVDQKSYISLLLVHFPLKKRPVKCIWKNGI